jgi:hypothetical protein
MYITVNPVRIKSKRDDVYIYTKSKFIKNKKSEEFTSNIFLTTY